MVPSLTPTTDRSTHQRTPSSPSLPGAVGLPPPLPTPTTSSSLMGPVTPTRRSRASLKRSREPATPVRVGEVSSTASSPDSDDDVPPNTAARHVRGGVTAPATPTPRRKVVNAIDVPSPRTTNTAAKKRETLQSRLAAASTPITGTPRKSAATTTVSTPGPSNSDKVVVCMR